MEENITSLEEEIVAPEQENQEDLMSKVVNQNNNTVKHTGNLLVQFTNEDYPRLYSQHRNNWTSGDDFTNNFEGYVKTTDFNLSGDKYNLSKDITLIRQYTQPLTIELKKEWYYGKNLSIDYRKYYTIIL